MNEFDPFENKEKEDLVQLQENQILLPNGKIITLNNEQVFSLEDIKDWINNPKSKSELFYTLSGFAGTGKTTIVKEAIKGMFGIAVSAPTHKAKKVISKSTKRNAVTIQSLLGLQPNTDLDNFNINKPQFDSLREPEIAEYRLVIIDEASMLNNDLFTLLTREAELAKTKVLFMGDSAQLPPVKEEISQVFVSNKITRKSQLTKVERQADGNPLMLIYDAIRNNISSPYDNFEHITKLNDKEEGIIFHYDVEEFKKLVLKEFLSDEYKIDKDHSKIISWTNEQVKVWNKIVRNSIFTKEDKECIEKGDLLMSYNSISGSYGQPLLENSSDFIVIDSRDCLNKWGFKGFKILLEDLDGYRVQEEVFILKPSEENYKEFLEEFDNRLAYAKRHKGSAWKAYYEFKNSNLLLEDLRDSKGKLIVKKDFDYGYAITIHKSQGSTYNTVFVTENVIDLNPNHEERNKLKYVAFSRPTKLAVSLSNKTIK